MLQVGLPELERVFLYCPGVDPGLVHEGWVQNHYRSALLQAVSTVRPTSCCCRWIVWSLASRERRQGVPALTAVMNRLKLRWKVTCDNMCSVASAGTAARWTAGRRVK